MRSSTAKNTSVLDMFQPGCRYIKVPNSTGSEPCTFWMSPSPENGWNAKFRRFNPSKSLLRVPWALTGNVQNLPGSQPAVSAREKC